MPYDKVAPKGKIPLPFTLPKPVCIFSTIENICSHDGVCFALELFIFKSITKFASAYYLKRSFSSFVATALSLFHAQLLKGNGEIVIK